MNQQIAWGLIFVGMVIVLVGLIWLLLPSVPWLGRLPGDIRIEGDDFQFYFPITTSILISVVLTAIMWLISWISSTGQ